MNTEQMTARTRGAQDEIEGQISVAVRVTEDLDAAIRRIRAYANETAYAGSHEDARAYSRTLATHVQDAQEALQQISARMFSITALTQEVSTLGVARFIQPSPSE